MFVQNLIWTLGRMNFWWFLNTLEFGECLKELLRSRDGSQFNWLRQIRVWSQIQQKNCAKTHAMMNYILPSHKIIILPFTCWFPIQITSCMCKNKNQKKNPFLPLKNENIFRMLIVWIQNFRLNVSNKRQTTINPFRILLKWKTAPIFFWFGLYCSVQLRLSNSCARRQCCNYDVLFGQKCTKRKQKKKTRQQNLEPLICRMKVYGNEH